MRINATDYKLIAELQQNGSLSYAELAKRLGLTTKTVARRTEWLLRSRIITIIAQPNPYKLGLFASALLAIRSDPAKSDMICNHLCDNFHVNHIQNVFGRFDIIATVFYPSWELLHKFIYEELYLINGVKHVEIYIINETFKRYERFFKNEPFETEQTTLSQIDWALIKALAADGRPNPGKLADELGVHKSTVYRKIETLSKGLFFKIRAVPNPFKLPPSANAYIIIDVGSADAGRICEMLQSHDEIHFVMTTNQQTFIIAFVHAADTYALYQFTREKILSLNGLTRTETLIRAAVRKIYYAKLDDFPKTDQKTF